MTLEGLEFTFVQTNGVRLHVAQAGPPEGRPVILLHGFPEFWYGWRRQIPALSAAGYRVWAPDQRGYNLSDKPYQASAYDLDLLAGDIAGLVEASGHEKAVVIGHDWGAAVAWWLATYRPERVEKLVVLNVPHPLVMAEAVRSDFRQFRKSWYVYFFQLPKLPEWALSRNGFEALERAVRDSARPATFGDPDMALYREAWGRPDALRGMLNWYRGGLRRHLAKRSRDVRIAAPTLILWGREDVALEASTAERSLELCLDGRLEFLDATHWVQHEQAERVNRGILDFIGE